MREKLPSSRSVIVFSLIFILAIVSLSFWQNKKARSITSFAECLSAGYPVTESSPRQCRAGEGQPFVESLSAEDEIVSQSGSGLVEYHSPKGETIKIKNTAGLKKISDPLTVAGEVKGSWSFEAQFPVSLTDEKGRVITSAVARLEGDWMSNKYVPFSATLNFSGQMPGSKGFLVLKKDNPSGLSEKNDAIEVPVVFGS